MSERVIIRKHPESIEWMPWMPWERRLVDATIVTSAWIADAGLTVEDDEVQNNSPASAPRTRVMLSGGQHRRRYLVTNRVVTSDGETIDWSFQVKVSTDPEGTKRKDPDSIEIFSVDWERKLVTVAIASSVFTVPSGLTLLSETFSGQIASGKISGGAVGTTYAIKNTITTDDAQTLVFPFVLRVTPE